MSKRFVTNGYKIYDTFYDYTYWLVNEVEAEEIVEIMNNLDTKARERSKALSKLQKQNDKLTHDIIRWKELFNNYQQQVTKTLQKEYEFIKHNEHITNNEKIVAKLEIEKLQEQLTTLVMLEK